MLKLGSNSNNADSLVETDPSNRGYRPVVKFIRLCFDKFLSIGSIFVWARSVLIDDYLVE